MKRLLPIMPFVLSVASGVVALLAYRAAKTSMLVTLAHLSSDTQFVIHRNGTEDEAPAYNPFRVREASHWDA